MTTIPFLIDSDSNGERLNAIDPGQSLYQENWLQEMIRLHPDILPVSEIESVFSPLIPIGREVPVTAGYIDNLFISAQGYPVIVETKLWKNPEAKRDVLAQLIDYASSVSDWSFEKLDLVARNYTKQFEGHTVGLSDWVDNHYKLEIDKRYFEETVSRNLRLGRILVLVVGDYIRSSVIDMLGYINKYPHLAMNVALIELKCYRVKKESDWPLLVVPSIMARTEIVERSIVQVNVAVDGTSKITATQEKIESKPSVNRSKLTEDEFWQRLKNQEPESLAKAQQLISYYSEKEGVVIQPRDNSIAAHLYLPETGQRISLFFIRTDGVIECWHGTIDLQLSRGGLEKQLLDDYVNDLDPILKHRTKQWSINYPLIKVDVDALIVVIDRFIQKLIQAEPKMVS